MNIGTLIKNLMTSKTTWAVWITKAFGVLAIFGIATTTDAEKSIESLMLILGALGVLEGIASRILKPVIVLGRDFLKFDAMIVLACAGLALGASGCATWTPALGGKTTAETIFKDGSVGYTDPATGEYVPPVITEYSRKVTVPAGVDLKGADGMSYKWDDKGGSIAINQEGAANTMGQATALTEINRQQIESMQAIINMALQIAGPLVGQRLTNDAAADVLKYQDKAGQRQALMDLFRDPGVQSVILEALTAPTAQP